MRYCPDHLASRLCLRVSLCCVLLPSPYPLPLHCSCLSTCVSTANNTCGYLVSGTFIGFNNCRDNSSCAVANFSAIGNGLCNVGGEYNTAACGWGAYGITCCELRVPG
jgi:hypothetical protein